MEPTEGKPQLKGLTQMSWKEISKLVGELVDKYVGEVEVFSYIIINDRMLAIKLYQKMEMEINDDIKERVIEWLVKAQLNDEGKLEIVEVMC